jgi:ribosomal protein S18 acetylase RimI-like enzyme
MSVISVRRLDEDEWARYRGVRLAALAEAPWAFGSTLAREQAFTEELWRERLAARSTFVACDDDGAEPRGLVGVIEADEPDTAELVSMWVHPDARGSGAADALVRAALSHAAERGFGRVHLWVAEGNDRAERLYARHGFKRTGIVQPIREGEEPMEFSMERVL